MADDDYPDDLSTQSRADFDLSVSALLEAMNKPESSRLEYKISDRVQLGSLVRVFQALADGDSGGYLIMGVREPETSTREGVSEDSERSGVDQRVVGLQSPSIGVRRLMTAAQKADVDVHVAVHDLFAKQVIFAHVSRRSRPTQPTTLPESLFIPRGGLNRRPVLVLATEWWSRHGGLSSFNRGLCESLARAGFAVTCYVPFAEADEISQAAKVNVELLTAPEAPGVDGPQALLRPPSIASDPEIIIGHGRITGPQAAALQADRYPRAARVHFIHTAAEEIEWFKDRTVDAVSTRAGHRDRVERDLARSATVVAAVGPLLARKSTTMLRGVANGPLVIPVVPGLAAGPSFGADPPPDVQVLVLGRTEDIRLKGLDIAAAALGSLDFAPLDLGTRPTLVVRGSPPEDAKSLHETLTAASNYQVPVLIRDWTVDGELLSADLARSTLVLMPSRHEGFGLVGLEAIGAGVPVLMSDTSGLGEYVASLGRRDFIVPTRASDPQIVASWARAIDRTLFDVRGAFRRAQELRTLYAADTSWDDAVSDLIAALTP